MASVGSKPIVITDKRGYTKALEVNMKEGWAYLFVAPPGLRDFHHSHKNPPQITVTLDYDEKCRLIGVHLTGLK